LNSWNSAFFSTTYAHQYQIAVVSNDFDTTTDFKCDLVYGCDIALELYNESKILGAWERLDNTECIQAYSKDFLAGRRNMIVVSTSTIATPPRSPYDTVINGSVFGVLNSSMYDYSLNLENSWHPNGWYCLDIPSSYSRSFIDSVWSEDINGCRMSDALAHAASLTVVVPGFGPYNIYQQSNGFVYEIDYCLSQVITNDKQCELNFVPYIMVIVIVCNIIKIICIALSYYTFSDPPLVLIGDAVASFLERRDLSTIAWRSTTAKGHPTGDRNGKSRQTNMRLWLQAPSLTSLLRCLLLQVLPKPLSLARVLTDHSSAGASPYSPR
jgi:hypothetical protein